MVLYYQDTAALSTRFMSPDRVDGAIDPMPPDRSGTPTDIGSAGYADTGVLPAEGPGRSGARWSRSSVWLGRRSKRQTQTWPRRRFLSDFGFTVTDRARKVLVSRAHRAAPPEPRP